MQKKNAAQPISRTESGMSMEVSEPPQKVLSPMTSSVLGKVTSVSGVALNMLAPVALSPSGRTILVRLSQNANVSKPISGMSPTPKTTSESLSLFANAFSPMDSMDEGMYTLSRTKVVSPASNLAWLYWKNASESIAVTGSPLYMDAISKCEVVQSSVGPSTMYDLPSEDSA